MTRVRVALPGHLRTLARLAGDTTVEVPDRPRIGDVLDALEATHPVLRGTIREHGTLRRRAFMRFLACERDLSHDPPETLLPDPVVAGSDVFRVVGAIAGSALP